MFIKGIKRCITGVCLFLCFFVFAVGWGLASAGNKGSLKFKHKFSIIEKTKEPKIGSFVGVFSPSVPSLKSYFVAIIDKSVKLLARNGNEVRSRLNLVYGVTIRVDHLKDIDKLISCDEMIIQRYRCSIDDSAGTCQSVYLDAMGNGGVGIGNSVVVGGDYVVHKVLPLYV
jgi:hypothetical protein